MWGQISSFFQRIDTMTITLILSMFGYHILQNLRHYKLQALMISLIFSLPNSGNKVLCTYISAFYNMCLPHKYVSLKKHCLLT